MNFLVNIKTAEHLDAERLSKSSADERAWRDAELLKADIEVNKATDTGSATEPAWRQYRSALRSWPQSAEFPDPSGRPTPPAGDPT